MSKIQLVVLLCLFGYTLNAQEEITTTLKTTKSSVFKDKTKVGSIKAMHTTATGKTGIIRFGRKSILVDVFNEDLGKEHTQLIDKERRERYKGHLNLDNKIYLFTTFSPELRERELFCYVIDLEKNTHRKNKLFHIDVKNAAAIYEDKNKAEASFSVSENQKYIAVATFHTKEDNNSYLMHVFEAETLSLVYETVYDAGEKNNYFLANDILITNDADVYVLTKQFLTGKFEKDKGNPNYDFVVHKISKNETKETVVSLENQYIRSLVLSNKKGKLHLIGFYSEKNAGRIKGGCDFSINIEDFTIASKKTVTLPQQVFNDLYGEKAEKLKEKEYELRNFEINYILDDAKGNTYLLAEEFYSSYTQTPAFPMGTVEEHYDDILILKFNAQGDLEWGRGIYKKASNPSYNAFIKNDELHVILNSGKYLKELDDGRYYMSADLFESSALYDIVYTYDGKASYTKIQNNRGKTQFTPFYGTFTNNVFIMANSRKNKKQFLKLE
ncbi:hypothetical protein [Kordia jejudonensis]|uniref:hypothetical protein n=1 Tax=Kordia jejudonensis TaxID=1348245 RepID=UPI0006291B97|nr:hypothetical protein [Kordia jejudonensis]